MKAHLCDGCAYFEPNREGVCLLQHRPYFYQPTERTVMDQQWGYKRRCHDHQPATDGGGMSHLAFRWGRREEVA